MPEKQCAAMCLNVSRGNRGKDMLALQFIDEVKRQLHEEAKKSRSGPQLLSVLQVSEKLSISTSYLTKHIMHRKGFPKPVRLTENGDLKFYADEIDAYILGLRG